MRARGVKIYLAKDFMHVQSLQVEISYHISWRRNYIFADVNCDDAAINQGRLVSGQGDLTCQSGCSGTITSMSFICTDFSVEENWSFGERRLEYNFSSLIPGVTVTVGFTGRDWIAPLSSDWNISTTFSLIRRNDTGRINSTPRAITAPVIRLQEGCNHTIALAVSDPDGDIVRCRWAVGSECGGICDQFPGAILDQSSCTITYEASQGARYWGVAVMIEDFAHEISEPLSSVALQFLVLVITSPDPCFQKPTFIPPTIRQGVCVAIPPQTMFNTQLTALSGASSISIVEIQTTSPLGMRKGDLHHINGSNTYFVNITWTPDDTQQNQTHLFCYTAINSDGLGSEQTCIQLFPGQHPPMPVQDSAIPNQQVVHPSNTTWHIRFDMDIQRPSVVAYITFHDFETEEVVYIINSSESQEVVFGRSDGMSVSPTHVFEEKKRFYINLERSVVQGLEGCGLGNEPVKDKYFWTFETMDVTPPTIIFLEEPVVSNTNVTLSWKSNEIVTWQCRLIKDGIEMTVNCSEANWRGYNLKEGSYDLEITAADEAGNQAELVHTFQVDLTPPTVTIMQKPPMLSNLQRVTFTFACNESICSFECTLLSNNISLQSSSCNAGRRYITPILEHNGNYTFLIVATDAVGNKGEPAVYSWETDFKSPQIFGIRNLSAQCIDVSAQQTGQPNATDDRSETVFLTHSDIHLRCSIRRTWTARDEAGNNAQFIQNIALEFSPVLSLVPQVALSCDSTAISTQVPYNTASAPNPCGLPLQLTHEELTGNYTCPNEIVRNWTVTVCDRSVSAEQTIILYDLCPPHACGRNETNPRGICLFGECQCNRPWHGADCSVLIYEPVVQPVNDTVLKEAMTYDVTIRLLQGTPPLSWTLLSGPDQLKLDQVTGRVTWDRARAGNYSISIQITNEVGTTVVEWNLLVEAGYHAFLDRISPATYSQAQPITLRGHVEYITSSSVEDFLMGIVPVHIDVISSGIIRTMTSFTTNDGQFSVIFHPSATEYGIYTAGARHPSSLETVPQTEWSFLGMSAMPRIISLNGEAFSTFEQIFHNVCVVCNHGPGPLSGLTAMPTVDSKSVGVQVMLHRITSNGILQPGDKIHMDIAVNTSMPLSRVFPIELATIQGTSLRLLVHLQVEQILPSFLISPPTLNTRIIRGRSRVFEFNVTNVGRAEASNVQVLFPDIEFLSFISFGGLHQGEDDQNLSLKNGQSSILSILVQTPETQQLGEISASIIVTTSREISKAIPITLTVSSVTLMNFTVVVEDEYTYFASGQPLVNNAAVTIINYQRGIKMTKGTDIDNGTITFENIYEDRYEMIVEAENHRTVHQVIITSVSEPTLTVFLERQAVTYTWSVTPVAFEDTYVLTIEADFETHVPIPVVTVTPNEFDLEDLELGIITSIQLNITNHGLIRANDVSIQLPDDHTFLNFTTGNNQLGNLEALSSIITTVQVSRKTIRKRSTVASCIYSIKIFYSYVCGTQQIRSVSVIIRGRGCTSNIHLQGSRSRSSGTGGVGYFRGYVATTSAFCNKCLQAVIQCLPVPKPPFSDCIPLILNYSDATNWISCTLSVGDWILKQTAIGKAIGKLEKALDLLGCFIDIYSNCLNLKSDGRKKRSLVSSVTELVEAMYPIHLSIALGVEILGDEVWLTVGDPMWLSQVLRPVLDDGSELGVLVSSTELSAVVAVPPPDGTSIEMVIKMVKRLNNTVHGWNTGNLEPEGDEDMASFSIVQELSQTIRSYNDKAISNGFLSYLDAYNFARNDVNQIDQWEEEAGVCAVVRIRVEQELAVTREAFLAKLEIENQEVAPLENMHLEIVILDSIGGQLSNHLFAIGTEKLSGSLMRMGGLWSLPSGISGAVEWLIVPYSEAAPNSDHTYNIGGSLGFTLDGENITIPLLPTLIVVRPDPSLSVHYFWEKNVIGDDPFSDPVEPSVPFTLGVAVKNAGYGTANQIQITSGQPEIIENEKGLLINFMLIGANVGQQSISPSLTVMLGDLTPNSTIVARWLMISSLMGEFKNYSATFENINPLGEPKLSILDELEIHELIRNVRMYNDKEEDGVLDFLVNERNDFFEYPDALYSSKTLTRYRVSVGVVLSVHANSDVKFTLEVRTRSNSTGWVYYRYEDADHLLSRSALTVNTTKIEANETIYLPPQNVWITRNHNSKKNTNTFYIHIVDHVSTTEELIFNLSLCTSDCPPVEMPYIPPLVARPLTPIATMPTFTYSVSSQGDNIPADQTTTGSDIASKGSAFVCAMGVALTSVSLIMMVSSGY